MCVLAGTAVVLGTTASAQASSSLPSEAAPYMPPAGPQVQRQPARPHGLRSQAIRQASSASLVANLNQVRTGGEVTFTGAVSYSSDLFGADISIRNAPVAL